MEHPGGAEDDARPLIAAAAEPWRPLDVHAGGDLDSLTVRCAVAAPATVGQTLSDLPPTSPHRLDRIWTLTVRLEGQALSSRTLAATLAGANVLAVQTPSGDWEVIGFATADLVAPEVWRLSGLLRGQRDGAASAATIPAGAAVVLLDGSPVRLEASAFERGTSLIVRAAPAGGPPAGPAMSQVVVAWTARALRPLPPAHLRVTVTGGDRLVSWIRRTRLGGDAWDGEVPLGEAFETWRLRVLNGAVVVREAQLSGPGFVHTAAMRTADLAAGTVGVLTVEVAQGSAVAGWGVPATRLL